MKPEELLERDWMIVRHIYRYRLSTKAIIAKQFFPEAGSSAARNVIHRLVTQGWIRKAKFAGHHKYLILDTRGIMACGADERQRTQFSDQTIPGFFGVLHFCLRTGHERLTRGDLRAIEPAFDTPAVWGHAHYVRNVDTKPSLGCLRVDRGKSPRRLVTRAQSLLVSRYKLPKFRELIESGHFHITLLTAYASMVEPIQREIKKRHTGPAPFYVEIVPELGPFLGGGA